MSKTNKPAAPATSRSPLLLVGLAVVVVAAVAAVVAIVLGNRQTAAPYTAEVTGQPSAVVAETVVDHGPVAFEQQVQSVYTVTNVGDEPLVILGEPRVELVAGC
jgi:hypothetical protein